MKLLFVANPLEQFNIVKDSTYVMMQEAAKRGYEIYTCESKNITYQNNKVLTSACKISIDTSLYGNHTHSTDATISAHSTDYSDNKTWFKRIEHVTEELNQFGAVLLRQDPPFDIEYVVSTWLLELAEKSGARVFNKPAAVRDFSEKLSIAQFPNFIPPTIVTADSKCLIEFHREHHDIILKPLDRMGGSGIVRVREDGLNLSSLIELISENGTRTITAQRYIPEIVKGDKRIILLGDQVVPYALARMPKEGEVRANLAVGNHGYIQELSHRDREIAESLAPILSKKGLLVVGLDLIGEYLTEINVTCPTCFQEITQQSGYDVAAEFMNTLEQWVRAVGCE